MSIELLLIPIGITVATSIGEMITDYRKEGETYSVKTVMKKQHLLQKAIEQYGCHAQELTQENYEAIIGEIKIVFQKNEQGQFEAVFDKDVSTEDALEFIENLHTEYKYLIQQETYQRLREQAESKGLLLESEQVQEDRSILLTYQVTSN
ncbi:hypothetical protein [Sutcliffiella horikoshii]|uniref:hypothetical protein n=1 Tax=Sutcliffiella horikoshii TaxID=79883 RepID=UPI001CFE5007|nr:hypothetical protein [Sutcliffiella horikoshii]